jgi:YD repeat-containing protein
VEYTPASRTTYSYDANGNTALVNADDSLTTYSWDIENRMTKAELPAGTLNTISYDGDGKRRSLEDSVMRRRKPRTVICFRDAGKVLW